MDASGALGSPATYGVTLATHVVRHTLAAAGHEHFADAIARADAWFLTRQPRATVDAAALVLAFADRARAEQRTAGAGDAVLLRLRETVDWILRSQTSDSGWGPYPKAPSEVFDTAMAVLALVAARESGAGDPEILAGKMSDGRDYLKRTQLPEGGWPETTRPSGNQSYAQHISTSGWAALALLRTRAFDRDAPR